MKLFEGEALGIFNGVKPAEESTESKSVRWVRPCSRVSVSLDLILQFPIDLFWC